MIKIIKKLFDTFSENLKISLYPQTSCTTMTILQNLEKLWISRENLKISELYKSSKVFKILENLKTISQNLWKSGRILKSKNPIRYFSSDLPHALRILIQLPSLLKFSTFIIWMQVLFIFEDLLKQNRQWLQNGMSDFSELNFQI